METKIKMYMHIYLCIGGCVLVHFEGQAERNVTPPECVSNWNNVEVAFALFYFLNVMNNKKEAIQASCFCFLPSSLSSYLGHNSCFKNWNAVQYVKHCINVIGYLDFTDAL